MWYSKHVTISFFWIFWLIDCGRTNDRPCHGFLRYEWQPNKKNDYKPGCLHAGLNKNRNRIETIFTKRKENFTFTALAKPFITDPLLCPRDPNTESDLRKFYHNYFIDVNSNDTETVNFGNVFTGCYYFIGTNEKKQNWLWGPVHHQTNYTYHDPMLMCNISDPYPGDEKSTRGLPITFKVPNKDFRLVIQLLELNSKSENENLTSKQYESGQITSTQLCLIDLVNCKERKGNATLKCQTPNTSVKAVQVNTVECGKDNSWKISVRWTGLEESDAIYYHKFSLKVIKGDHYYSDFATWVPATKLSTIYHIAEGGSNKSDLFITKSAQIDWKIVCAISAAATILFFAVGIRKFITNRSKPKNKWNDTNVVLRQPEEAWLYDEEKSKNILLMYARGSEELMQATNALRDHLKNNCTHQVRDIYSADEWDEVVKLTAPKWIEKIMKDGSKVVWIDTPQLRSHLSKNQSNTEEQNQCDVIDFRDMAVSYAVDLAKTSLDSSTTQYLHHFVVRIKGFDVTDGDENPLRIFVPFTRYRYPEYLDDLCEHLNK